MIDYFLTSAHVIDCGCGCAFNGNHKKNPYHFQQFYLSKIAPYWWSESIPGHPFTSVIANGHYSHSYANTIQIFLYFNIDDSNEFGNGYISHAYDLTPDDDIKTHIWVYFTAKFMSRLVPMSRISSTPIIPPLHAAHHHQTPSFWSGPKNEDEIRSNYIGVKTGWG